MTLVALAFSTSEASKSKFWKSQIRQNLIEPQSFAGPLLRLGTSAFGSKLSIHTLSQGLSVKDLSWSRLFYLRRVKVKFADFEIGQNKFTASIFTRPPYTFGTSPFGSELSIHALWVVFSFKDFGCTCLLYLGGIEVKFADSEIGQNKFTASIFTRPPYTFGTSPFGSELSIHALWVVFSFKDFGCTCLLYLGGIEVKFADSEIGQNKFTASIFTRPPYTFGTSPFGSELSIHALWVVFCFKNFGWSWQLSSDQVKVRQNWSKCGKSDPAISVILIICLLKLGLKTLYTSMTNAFSPIRPNLKLTLTSEAVNFSPISTAYFGRPLARLPGLRWPPSH